MSLCRLRFKIFIVIAAAVLLVVLTSLISISKPREARKLHRKLKWYVYDDYENSPVKEYIDLPPRLTRTPSPEKVIFFDEETTKKNYFIDFPWAREDHDYTAEAKRFLALIQTIHTQKCSNMFKFSNWSCCLSPSLENGILYTFDVEQENDLTFEMSLLEQCSLQEIHAYNPNILKPESTDDPFIFHKIALDTESNEKLSKDGRNKSRRWRRQTFSEIRTSLNHITLSLIRLNMNSSEWKILKQILENGEIMRVQQLLVKIHLHWAGFGISGSNEEVVHQWFNILSSILESGMSLVQSQSVQEPKIFMSEPGQFDASCCYYLTFTRIP